LTAPDVRAAQQRDEQTPAPDVKEQKKAASKNDDKNPTAEQVAETVVLVYGARERLAQIRRSGIERGRLMRTTDDGRNEEIAYELSFKRGATFDKDKMRLDQRKPTQEYSLFFNEGRIWGVVKGATFTPRQQDVDDLLEESRHGLETLLRYKENGATLAYVGKEKQKGIEMWVLDLTDKEKRVTRYYISAQSGRVLWLEYEARTPDSRTPVKFRKTFHDYRIVQGTRVPYRTVLYADGKQVEEALVSSVTYGVKMEDSAFQNPDAASLP
jgi:hypothetical protein